MHRRDLISAAAGTAVGSVIPLVQPGPLEVAINHGRVIDPASRTDRIRHLGIRQGRIAVVSDRPLRARMVIDAQRLIVSPGFIDLHAHGQDLENNRVQALDGVTTTLELETGPVDVDRWYAERAGQRILNYGACVGHIAARNAVLSGRPTEGFNRGLDQALARQTATAEQISAIGRLVERGLERGALSVGFGIQYVPGTSRAEVLAMFRIAARHRAMCGLHQRYAGVVEPDGLAGIEELVAAALVTGTQLHIEHITSNTGPLVREALALVAAARDRGLAVTADTHPYTAAMTGIETAVFDPGWQQRFQIDYRDLEWAATGERLTAERFARYREQGGSVVIHSMKEDDVTAAVGSPLTAIISDGELVGGKGHPRSAGTFCRVLGRYVRERGVLTWAEAIRKMSFYPAQIVGGRVTTMRRKGRLSPGADADIVIFDPSTVIDRADYASPATPSVGMRYVLVNGEFVVRDGELVDGARPGTAVRHSPTAGR